MYLLITSSLVTTSLQVVVRIVTVLAILMTLGMPNQALALSQATKTPLPTAMLAIATKTAENHIFPAVPTTASYSYRETGAVVSTANPIMERANWPQAPTVHIAPSVALVVPRSGSGLVLEGEASYYSRAGCLGCNPLFIMANGQPLDDGALTMAIGADKKHLVGYHARVTSLATGKSVTVKITDTGGFYKDKYGNRVADLTIATKQAIGMAGGVGQVRVEIL